VVQPLAAQLGITLLCLPSHSPNLNLIERCWKFMRSTVIQARPVGPPERCGPRRSSRRGACLPADRRPTPFRGPDRHDRRGRAPAASGRRCVVTSRSSTRFENPALKKFHWNFPLALFYWRYSNRAALSIYESECYLAPGAGTF